VSLSTDGRDGAGSDLFIPRAANPTTGLRVEDPPPSLGLVDSIVGDVTGYFFGN
jgi:hypothetical protein